VVQKDGRYGRHELSLNESKNATQKLKELEQELGKLDTQLETQKELKSLVDDMNKVKEKMNPDSKE